MVSGHRGESQLLVRRPRKGKLKGMEVNTGRRELTRNDALVIEGHIFLVYDQSTDTFLPVPRRKLVPELRSPGLADQNLDERLVVLSVGDHDLIYLTRNGRLVGHWRILVRNSRRLAGKRIVVGVRWSLLVDVNIAGINTLPDAGETVGLNDVIFFLDLPVLVQRRVREPIKPTARAKVRAQRKRSPKEAKLNTHVPLGYFRMSVAFLRNTWHRPYPRSRLA